jgi:uncharacterized membrane protein
MHLRETVLPDSILSQSPFSVMSSSFTHVGFVGVVGGVVGIGVVNPLVVDVVVVIT